ncbi:MAG: peptide chain release factor N(5)-glutamine methyltransferase, partial [Alphaproteobacteria bacterium]|nr:peptide chain release factor N(5)-glutamine methyltransferase [Alphaproteobacteria bacterium]
MKGGSPIADVAARLKAAGIESARLEARILLRTALAIPGQEVEPCQLTEDAAQRLADLIERRLAHEPLAYITGRKEFWGLEFAVGPGVLVPRPETETLIEEFQRDFRNRSEEPLDILDLGTGSGCLLISALSLFPRARGRGIDNTAAAIAWAKRNVLRHAMEQRCRLELANWSEIASELADAILVNPPYVAEGEIDSLAPEVSAHEPRSALTAG